MQQQLKVSSRTGLLMTECDEVDKWRKKGNRTVELFGQKLYFDNTINLMAQRSEAPVVGVFMKRTGRGKFTLYCELISSGKRGENPALISYGLLEKYINNCSGTVVPVEKMGGNEGCFLD